MALLEEIKAKIIFLLKKFKKKQKTPTIIINANNNKDTIVGVYLRQK